MEIQKIVIRRPVSTDDKLKGLAIIMSIDMTKFPKTIDTIKSLPFDKQREVFYTAVKIDRAARLLGFLSVQDMTTFIDMYGPDSLL
jgi:hypothetical protein